jgi:hypothetical protein
MRYLRKRLILLCGYLTFEAESEIIVFNERAAFLPAHLILIVALLAH